MAEPDGPDLEARPELHTDRPHPARVYDYLLGGRDNLAADREAARKGPQANPDSRILPRENRLFLRRAVRFLAEQGIDQAARRECREDQLLGPGRDDRAGQCRSCR